MIKCKIISSLRQNSVGIYGILWCRIALILFAKKTAHHIQTEMTECVREKYIIIWCIFCVWINCQKLIFECLMNIILEDSRTHLNVSAIYTLHLSIIVVNALGSLVAEQVVCSISDRAWYHIPCSHSLQLLESFQGSLGTYDLIQKCAKNFHELGPSDPSAFRRRGATVYTGPYIAFIIFSGSLISHIIQH